jgi:sigma-54 dependent transcriptional regulator, flagellar regulatory protein
VNIAGKGLLLIDADEGRRQQLKTLLQGMGAAPVYAVAPHEWRYQIESRTDIRVVLLGPSPGTTEQLGLYEALRELCPHVAALLYHGKDQSIPVDIELNAAFFVRVFEWPIKPEQLTTLLQQAVEYVIKQQPALARSPELFRALVGRSDGIQRVRELIERVSATDASVLILGEVGTGKEVVARNLHYHSVRRGKPFVAVNCGAIPAELLEAELFGQEGSAATASGGRIHAADGGTLFLDEIGDMPLALQVKLLRVIEQHVYERAGGTRALPANVRVIAATHRNLEHGVETNSFRKDLYYCLNVFPIQMPPLRERTADIPLLVAELNARLMRERGSCVRLSASVVDLLQRYSWPGNVRELANLIERLAILYPDRMIEIEQLPPKYRTAPRATMPTEAGEQAATRAKLPPGGLDLKEYMNHIEYSLIMQALSETGGVVAHAAALLKLPRTTLVEKLRKYGVRGDGTVREGAVSNETSH